MKNLSMKKQYLGIAFLILTLTACTIERRVHQSGLHIEFGQIFSNRSSENPTKKAISANQKSIRIQTITPETTYKESQSTEKVTIERPSQLLRDVNIKTQEESAIGVNKNYAKQFTCKTTITKYESNQGLFTDSSIAPIKKRNGEKSANWGLALCLIGIASVAVLGTFLLSPIGLVLSSIGLHRSDKGTKTHKRARAGVIWGTIVIILDIVVILLLISL
jgi:hypothetical protein